MNWTGGSLTRSRNAKSSVVATQKKHFAKAREKLYHGPQPPLELDFSVFEPNATIIKRFHTPQALLRSSQEDDECSQKISQQTWRNAKSVETCGESLQPLPNALKAVGGTHFKSAGNVSRHRCGGESSSLPNFPTCDQDLGKEDVATSAEDEFEAKKTELLGMRDWCGLESTRPVRMTFEDPEDRDMIGRRRRLYKTAPTEERRHYHRPPKSGRHSSRSIYGSQKHSTSGADGHSPCIQSDGFSEHGGDRDSEETLGRRCSISDSNEMLIRSTPTRSSDYSSQEQELVPKEISRGSNSNVNSDDMLLDGESPFYKRQQPYAWDLITPTQSASPHKVPSPSQRPHTEHGLHDLDLSLGGRISVNPVLEHDHLSGELGQDATYEEGPPMPGPVPIKQESLSLDEQEESWLKIMVNDEDFDKFSVDGGKGCIHE